MATNEVVIMTGNSVRNIATDALVFGADEISTLTSPKWWQMGERYELIISRTKTNSGQREQGGQSDSQ